MKDRDFFVEVLKEEARALNLAADRIDSSQIAELVAIFQWLKSIGGNLVFCGVGKSGHIARKISSTFSSLGLPSYFLHPVEALHGDLGKLSKSDAMVLISNSGTTEEIMKMLPYLPICKERMIGLIGNQNSPLAQRSGVVLNCSVEKEACIHNQAPTTSTTVALGMGDAMAVLFERVAGLSKEGFAQNHPGGLLGKSLSLKVSDLMLGRDECPFVDEKASIKDVILAMTRQNSGMCAVLDDKNRLLGIVVEGDVRRYFSTITNESNALKDPINEIMTKDPKSTTPKTLAYDALKMMEDRKSQISVLPVLQDSVYVGQIRLHDLLKEGFLSSKSVGQANNQ